MKYLRKIAQLVEWRFPKPKDRGSNPFFPVRIVFIVYKFIKMCYKMY